MNLLAEISPTITEQFLGSWVAAAIVLIAGVAGLFGIISFFATQREVRAMELRMSATESDLKGLREKMDRDRGEIYAKMDRDKSEVLAAGSVRANNLHLRIDGLDQHISTISGELKTISLLFGEVIKKEIHRS